MHYSVMGKWVTPWHWQWGSVKREILWHYK